MANPPVAQVYVNGALTTGYPVYGSYDGTTTATPVGNYVWNPALGGSGLWVPAPVDANGVPQMSLTGSSATLVSSGTVNVPVGTAGQFSNSITLPVPYRNWAVAWVNNSGETITGIAVYSQNVTVVPNTPSNPHWLLALTQGLSAPNGAINTTVWADTQLNVFDNKIVLHWVLGAATTAAGTIDYALWGW